MKRNKHISLYLASFGIPCVLFLITLMMIGAVPFGDNTILISDANGQYLDFLSYWKTVLSGENNLFYTFSKNMGGDMLNLAAYYLLSPVNLIVLFSTRNTLPIFYTAIVTFKISICGVSFFHLASRWHGPKASNLLFSTAYSLTAYNVLYGWNTMWLDGVMILPLLALGIFQLMEHRVPWLYILSLFYGLATNFYIGYMLCITAVLLFLAVLFLNHTSAKHTLHCLASFCTASILGGFASAVFWLPTILSIAGERVQSASSGFDFSRNFNLYGFLPKFVCGAASATEAAGGMPHVFCTTIVLLLVLAFFFNPKNHLRIKLTAGGILFLILISFYLKPLNIVWHGFAPNNSFNYRYSFVFSFILICIALYQYEHRYQLSAMSVHISAACILSILLITIFQNRSFSNPLGTAASTAALLFSVFVLLHPSTQLRTCCLLCAFAFIELNINCTISWSKLIPEFKHIELSSYQEFVRDTGDAIDYVKSLDSGFYRLEKNYHRSRNDSMLFSYNGLSHFSSTEPVFPKIFMRKMGFPTEETYWAWYEEGSTSEADSLLGVKYLLSQTDITNEKNYSLLSKSGNIRIYQNPYALPVTLLCQSDILTTPTDQTNLYEFHNEIWQDLTGIQKNILIPATFTVSTQNLDVSVLENGYTIYSKVTPSECALIRYEVTVTQELPISFYISAPAYQQADLYINGCYDRPYFDMNRWNMVSAGTHAPSQTLVIELHLTNNTLCIGEPMFYYEDIAALADLSASIQASAPQIHQLSSSQFEGSFTANSDQLLLFTIPFNEGWNLQIDGVSVPCRSALDMFLSAEVTAGTHHFSLSYIPKGFIPGLLLTLISIVCLCAWYVLRRKNT